MVKKYIAPKATFWQCEFCKTILEFDDIIDRMLDLKQDNRVIVDESYGVTSIYLKTLCDCYSIRAGRYYHLHREQVVELLGREKVAYTEIDD